MYIRKPFEPTRLEEERATDTRRVLPVNLSEGDQELINELKQLWGIQSDGRILRLCLSRVGSVELGKPTERFWGGLLNNKQMK